MFYVLLIIHSLKTTGVMGTETDKETKKPHAKWGPNGLLPGSVLNPNGRKSKDRTNQLVEELRKRGIKVDGPDFESPIAFLYRIMTNDHKYLGLPPGFQVPLDMRFASAKELSGYQMPKLKAIEHSGAVGGMTPVAIVCSNEADLAALEQELDKIGDAPE